MELKAKLMKNNLYLHVLSTFERPIGKQSQRGECWIGASLSKSSRDCKCHIRTCCHNRHHPNLRTAIDALLPFEPAWGSYPGALWLQRVDGWLLGKGPFHCANETLPSEKKTAAARGAIYRGILEGAKAEVPFLHSWSENFLPFLPNSPLLPWTKSPSTVASQLEAVAFFLAPSFLLLLLHHKKVSLALDPLSKNTNSHPGHLSPGRRQTSSSLVFHRLTLATPTSVQHSDHINSYTGLLDAPTSITSLHLQSPLWPSPLCCFPTSAFLPVTLVSLSPTLSSLLLLQMIAPLPLFYSLCPQLPTKLLEGCPLGHFLQTLPQHPPFQWIPGHYA